MGLLRKRTSKPSLKKDAQRAPTPPPQLPPLPEHVRQANAAAAAAAAAGVSPKSGSSTPASRRRSKSLWANSDEARAAVTGRQRRDSLGGSPGAQPWRSREAWLALHSPPEPTYKDHLVLPCSPSGVAPGWRGRGGGGNFFSTGAELDHEVVRKADDGKMPAKPWVGARAPPSPRARHVRQTPSPPMPSERNPARRLDFDSTTPPRAEPATPSPNRQSPSADPTPADTNSPSTPNVLLTPNSLQPAMSPKDSRSPSPLQRTESAGSATHPAQVTPSRPSRALPPAPVSQSEDGHEVLTPGRPLLAERSSLPAYQDPAENETIDFTSNSPAMAPSARLPSRSPRSMPSAHPPVVPVAIPACSTPPQAVLNMPPASVQAQLDRPPSRNTSSSSHHSSSKRNNGGLRSRSTSSAGHSAGEPGNVPHTPQGIQNAVHVWRQKSKSKRSSRDTDSSSANGHGSRRLPSEGSRRPQHRDQKDVPGGWPGHTEEIDAANDPFAPPGAWQDSYYDQQDYDAPPAFTAPLRLPQISPPMQQKPRLSPRLPQHAPQQHVAAQQGSGGWI